MLRNLEHDPEPERLIADEIVQMNLGIAIYMATSLKLHNEETFQNNFSSPQVIQKAESARRTLISPFPIINLYCIAEPNYNGWQWALFCQENLLSEATSIIFLSPCDMTALLPCGEHDFIQGQDPQIRAALAGTPSANENPESQYRMRSLFASLVQIFDICGTIKRKLPINAQRCRQGDLAERIKQRLKQLEDRLPEQHTPGTRYY